MSRLDEGPGGEDKEQGRRITMRTLPARRCEMPVPVAARRGEATWLVLTLMGLLLLGLVVLGVLQFLGRKHPYENPDLMAELAKADFTNPEYVTTGDWPAWRGP